MGMKTYLDSEKTKLRVLNSIKDLASIVGKTLGPGGRPILLEQDGPPLFTKDGVTVARHFNGDGDIEKVVSQASIEVCDRTNRACGDGTTTAIVLAAALVEAGQEFLEDNPDYSPQRLSRELKQIYETVIKPSILKLSKPIKNLPLEEGKRAIRHVAMVSSNHDEEIADAVAEAVAYVGEDGVVHAEEGTGSDTNVVKEDGFPFNSGLADLGGTAAAAFINRKEYEDCFIEGAYVALYDGDINDINTIAPLLQMVASEVDEKGNQIKSPLIVFAHNFSDQVLKVMARNFRAGTLSVVPVKTSSNGQALSRSQFLFDVAAYTGGTVFDSMKSPLQNAVLPQLGFISSLKYTKSEGILLGESEQETIEKRIDELKKQMENASDFDRDLFRFRIGRLTGGVATIYAGGKTAAESKERHSRLIDAVSSVRSALEMGVVPGGGATLNHIANSLPNKGVKKIFNQALRQPFLQILENVGMELGVNQIDENTGLTEDGSFRVYNALTNDIVEWYSGGIVDPAKVAVSALENAISVAQLLMTLGGLIVVEQSKGSEDVKAMQDSLSKMMENMTE